jgi:hypothetical protein
MNEELKIDLQTRTLVLLRTARVFECEQQSEHTQLRAQRSEVRRWCIIIFLYCHRICFALAVLEIWRVVARTSTCFKAARCDIETYSHVRSSLGYAGVRDQCGGADVLLCTEIECRAGLQGSDLFGVDMRYV